MEVQGKIKVIGATETFGDSGFRKRELVVVTEEQYPQPIMIEFVQDKCNLVDNFSVGQSVKVSINLRGREWLDPKKNVNRYFNSIQGWRIEQAQEVEQQMSSAPTQLEKEANDDLPF